MEEATIKFVKTFIPYMGLFPVLRSKGGGGGGGGGGSINFPRKSKQHESGAVFICPEHQIHPPSCLQSKISLVRSTLRIKSQQRALEDVSGEVLIDQTSSWQ